MPEEGLSVIHPAPLLYVTVAVQDIKPPPSFLTVI